MSLLDEVVVVTGVIAGMTRLDVEDAVYQAGGTNAGAVTPATTLLVVGTKPGQTKLQKALALGIQTIDESEFRRRLAS
jgi:NAD-dependent DNA ligase (contains BRCT domain ty pe II)